MALLLIVTVNAHDAVFVLGILVFVADGTLKLQSASLISSDQAQRHTSTAARERESSSVMLSGCSAVVDLHTYSARARHAVCDRSTAERFTAESTTATASVSTLHGACDAHY